VVPRLATRITAAAAAVQLGYADYDDIASGLRRFAWRRGAGRLQDEMQTYLFTWIQEQLCDGIDHPIPPLTVECWNLLVWTWAYHQEREQSDV
jgi:hypothetical protein